MATPQQATRLTVEVVALAKQTAFTKQVLVPRGQTVGWAVNASGLYGQHPALRGAKLGAWGKVLAPETLVEEGDRIEVYMPLDPQALAAHRSRLRKAAV